MAIPLATRIMPIKTDAARQRGTGRKYALATIPAARNRLSRKCGAVLEQAS